MTMDHGILWNLWAPYAADTADSGEEWARLIERWSEPHRAYHTLEHLLLMLTLLDEQHAAPETILAAWYHDAVYDPTSTTNERDSADLARQSLAHLDLSIFGDRVAELVELTALHECAPGDEQAALLLDADLAILGQSPALYLRYVEGVRREYAHVSDVDFRSGRAKILRELLSRERIYLHPTFDELEPRARANIGAELTVYAESSSAAAETGTNAGAWDDADRPP